MSPYFCINVAINRTWVNKIVEYASDFPLELASKANKIGPILAFSGAGILFFCCVTSLSWGGYEVKSKHVRDVVALYILPLAFGLLALYLAWAGWNAKKAFSKMLINDRGITITTNDGVNQYDWRDLESASYIVYDVRTQTKVLRLNLKNEKKKKLTENIVWNSYGIKDEELENIIKYGINKWGLR